MNILGVVVKALPEYMQSVQSNIESQGLGEVYAQDEQVGKLVVVVEGEDDSEALGRLREITALAHVISADLIHLASESDPDEVSGAFPEALNDESGAQNTCYSGSVYHWLAKNS